MKKQITFILFSVMILYSCTKDKPPIPEPVAPIQCWEKFIGDYIVYDTINDTSWVMSITHELDTNQFGTITDYINIINFYHQFDLHFQFSCCSVDTTWTEFTCLNYGMSPATNYMLNRYNVYYYSDDASTPYIENRLKNDTLVLYFRMENTLYWMPDAVIYEDNYHKHIAVKQN